MSDVTADKLRAAVKKETKKAVKLRDAGKTDEAAEHLKVVLKLRKALAKQEKKELKAAIKEETHLAVTHRDAGETEIATTHLKNVQKLKKKLAALEEAGEHGHEVEAEGEAGGSAKEQELAALQKELKVTAKSAMKLKEAGKVEAAAEMDKLKAIQKKIKALKAEIKAEAAVGAAATEAEAAAEVKAADAADAAQPAAASEAAADAGPSADGDEEEDDDPFKITDDMTEEEKMNIRYARIAAEQKAAREAEMRAMVSAAKKNVVEEASTVAQVDANEPMWVKQQKYAFAGWVNSILAEVGLHVQRDISKAFDDGLFLIPLAELLTEDYCAPHVKRPKFRIQKIQNVDLAMQLFRKHGFRGSYSNENLVDGNRELVLGFIFTLFVEFVGGDKSSRSKSDDILKWVQDHVNDKPQYGVHVGDLSGSFKDGRAFGALLNALDNEYLDYGSAISADGHVANHEAAYDAAHNVLGVPKLLQAADMTAPDSDPDDKAVKMYLMLIRAAHAKRVADATARDSFAASLRDRLEAMDTGDLWRLYDGLCNHDGDCPECQCDLTPYFVFTRYPSKASTIKPLVEL